MRQNADRMNIVDERTDNIVCNDALAKPTVSVIMTVYNEAGTIERLLDSLRTQTLQPSEIVICDGGSSDDTVAIIHQLLERDEFPSTRLLVEAGANISQGRNLAIDAATGPIIAATDAGVRLEPTWLEALVAPWFVGGKHHADVVAAAGFFLPDVRGVFETAMAATVLPLHDEIDAETFLPSSRSVAFTKRAWRAAGGYPEWLDYCEDLLFDFAINGLGERQSMFHWSPNAVVYFQPRTSLASFWRQYYLYARGDGKADLWRKRHAARYVTYLILLPLLIGSGLWGGALKWIGWVGLIAGVIVYCRRPWQRLQNIGAGLSLRERMQAALLVPLIRGVGDWAKMVGYPPGLLWRWRNRDRSEIYWR